MKTYLYLHNMRSDFLYDQKIKIAVKTHLDCIVYTHVLVNVAIKLLTNNDWCSKPIKITITHLNLHNIHFNILYAQNDLTFPWKPNMICIIYTPISLVLKTN